MSLQEYVKLNQEARENRAQRARKERERIEARYRDLITALERNPESIKALELLREINMSDWNLRRFLRMESWVENSIAGRTFGC